MTGMLFDEVSGCSLEYDIALCKYNTTFETNVG